MGVAVIWLFHPVDCSESGQLLFVCRAENTIKNQPLYMSRRERSALVQRGIDDGRRKREDLRTETIELAIGMNVMPGMTSNIIIATDLQLNTMNRYGARGMTVDVILNPEDPELPRY